MGTITWHIDSLGIKGEIKMQDDATDADIDGAVNDDVEKALVASLVAAAKARNWNES